MCSKPCILNNFKKISRIQHALIYIVVNHDFGIIKLSSLLKEGDRAIYLYNRNKISFWIQEVSCKLSFKRGNHMYRDIIVEKNYWSETKTKTHSRFTKFEMSS